MSAWTEDDNDLALGGIAIKEVMSDPLLTIAPHASVQEAVRLMMDQKIGGLLVLEGPKLGGIITEMNMLKLVVDI